jgi:predicted nucleic acid-binding protein
VIILDTNVISALMMDEPEPAVARWLDRQPRASIWTTSVTIYELTFGIECLPASR